VPGAAKVTVSIDADFNKVTQSSEKYDPESRVVRSKTTVEDSENDQDMQPGDQTTVANNVPTGPSQPPRRNPPARNRRTATNQRSTTRSTRRSARSVIEGGAVKRLSVAVALDQVRVPGKDGAPAAWQDRTPEGIARISALVKSAVLFRRTARRRSHSRKHRLSPADHDLDGGVAPGAFEFDKFDLVRIGEILALVLTALALVFFVLRPLVSGL